MSLETAEQLITEINNLTTGRLKYAASVEITSDYYHLEINGIYIEDIYLENDTLTIVTWNKRELKLRIIPSFQYKLTTKEQ